MLGLVGTVDRSAEIFALLLRQRRELDADFFEVQTRDFFVELLRRQGPDAGAVRSGKSLPRGKRRLT